MKYLKTFENRTELFDTSECDVFWEVTTKQPYFDVICWKLGVFPEDRYEFIKDKENLVVEVPDIICIEKFCEITDSSWEWDKTKAEAESLQTKLKYKGKITESDITEEDIKQWKTEIVSKKYNL